MAKLSDLPSELLEQILLGLPQAAYCSLSQVSKSLYAFITPHLYRDISLLIRSSDSIPRADTLFFNFLNEPRLGKHVRSLRLGVKSQVPSRDVRRCMPIEDKSQHRLSVKNAMKFVQTWRPMVHVDDFREGLETNDYGVCAALLFLLVLPTLRHISIADNGDETLRPLKYVLDNIRAEEASEDGPLLRHLESIKAVTYNFDDDTATPDPRTRMNEMRQSLILPDIESLELSTVTHSQARARPTLNRFRSFKPSSTLAFLSSLVIRSTMNIAETLHGILAETPQLRSLTCEAFCDTSKTSLETVGPPMPWISLEQWNAELSAVRYTLETLVISVELSNGDSTFFDQPDLKPHVSGRLDLGRFDQLHTVEIPAPFLTDNAFLWIGSDTNYLPFAPPNLRHLTLRTDMTDAQRVYPWDTSIRDKGPTFQESKEEARFRDQARMDLTCIFQIALAMIDQLPYLQSFAVWQPPDPSLDMFDNQLEDLRTSCKNKSITAKIIYPMLLRWKNPIHWNLARECTLFDARFPDSGLLVRMFRGERQGIPLGLASQYHLGEFKKHHVRKHR